MGWANRDLVLYPHISGALLLIDRIAHPFGLKSDNARHMLRFVGIGTNILAALNVMIWLGLNILGLSGGKYVGCGGPALRGTSRQHCSRSATDVRRPKADIDSNDHFRNVTPDGKAPIP